MVRVVGTNSISALRDVVGEAPQQHTTKSQQIAIVKMALRWKEKVDCSPHDILHTRPLLVYVDDAAHVRLRRMQTARRRSPRGRFRIQR